MEYAETVIVGGGQAGLSVSYYLTQQGHNHVVLEQAERPAEAWRNHRWDSFTLVTPNWMIRLPGAEYRGHDPDGFLPLTEIVAYFEQYVSRYQLPVRFGVRVTAVTPSSEGYEVQTDQGVWRARQVVIATGSFQKPKIPPFSAHFPPEIKQLSADAYRNPAQLPVGAVLVVGSAQSGCQIAEELYQSGRKVYLCVGKAGRILRRYRGRDSTDWLKTLGLYDRTVDKLPSPKARFAGNPHVSGKNGGHTLNLHQFARDGVTLLGHLQGVEGDDILLAGDLHESLAFVDKFAGDLVTAIDDYISQNGLDAPAEAVTILRDGYAQELVERLDWRKAGITSVIWATGYTFDFRLVKRPIFDEDGYPRQIRGVTEAPGLYFVGLHWLHSAQSTLLLGVGEDARHVAAHIVAREKHE